MKKKSTARTAAQPESLAAGDLLLKAAREELERAKDHVPLAAERLAELVINHPVYTALRDEMVEEGCKVLLGRLRQERTRGLFKGRSATQSGERLVNWHRSLLDYPLPGGKKLRYADKKTLRSAAVHYRHRAAGQTKQARWFERLAKGLAPGQTVEDVYDEAAVEQMQQEKKNA